MEGGVKGVSSVEVVKGNKIGWNSNNKWYSGVNHKDIWGEGGWKGKSYTLSESNEVATNVY
jgi:hypothetical protein